jgi:HD-GYP domain-containing protein (c-di-GMP phosphodiesterase class II)
LGSNQGLNSVFTAATISAAMSTFNINLHEAVYSLSDALDLVGVTHFHHGKRVAYIAAECGKRLGWQGQCLDDLFQSAILHDCGVSKTAVHARLAQFEWEQDNDHCQIGSRLLSNCSMLAHLSDIILHHHSHWSVVKNLDLPMQVKLSANCIYLADSIDVLSLACLVDESNLLLNQDVIIDKIIDKRDDWFCPDLVDVFIEIAQSNLFWLALESGNSSAYTATWKALSPSREMEFCELKSLVYVFSHIIDAKSSYTKEHSDGVGNLARFIGEQMGLAEESCEMLELAGLLHDIGKLRVPDELLEKHGKLTEEEYAIVQKHSFDTYEILKNINGLEKITEWAAQHHERINGGGYPQHVKNGELSLEARIVAVADVFQALAQNRPYRTALDANAILAILRDQARDGQLDAGVVSCIDNNLQACFKAAHCQ